MRSTLSAPALISAIRLLTILIWIAVTLWAFLDNSEDKVVGLIYWSGQLLIVVSLILSLILNAKNRKAYILLTGGLLIPPLLLILLVKDFFSGLSFLLLIVWPIQLIALILAICLDIYLLKNNKIEIQISA